MAWIETKILRPVSSDTLVATREGGVDRNCEDASAPSLLIVATREGGVDRNTEETKEDVVAAGRHPRGWRG